jgi:protein-S-isoprenylcysteine O-methyltransferase Ste14
MIRRFHEFSIPALWTVWLIYWGIAAIGAKQTRREESSASRLSHMLPLALGVGLLATQRVPFDWLATRFIPNSPTAFWTGFALVAFGLMVSVGARVSLGGNWSGTVTLKQDHELIRSGPYRWVRHPIYTGLLLAFLGSAVALGQWRGLAALALVTFAFVRKIGIEERFLMQHFGVAYARYRSQVPSLVPLPRRTAT